MIGGIVSFSSMGVAGRELAGELDTFEIMFFRSLAGVVIVTTLAAAFGRLNEIRARRLGLHLARNLFHFSGQNLWFYAVAVIPLAQVFALEFTSPLWVTLFAPFLLGERLTRLRLLSVAMGFLGVVVVVRPDFATIELGVMTAAASAIGFGGSIVLTKLLTRTETITCILFWLTVMQSVMGLIATGWDGEIALPSRTAMPWVLLVAVAGLTAHFCLTKALTLASAVIVVPMDFVRLPAIAVLGWILYGETLDIFVLLGALVIFGANYLNIWVETKTAGKNRARSHPL
ncbi:MAG: DMT family transporter [Pseudomonadota bacterium]